MEPVLKIVANDEDMRMAVVVRAIVFIDEQCCPYAEEYDGRDDESTHFIATVDGEPAATARLRMVGDKVKMERVAVRREYRGRGLGRRFFAYVLDHAETMGGAKIVMHAQSYIAAFYESFGFERSGPMFLEAGIEHYYMEKENPGAGKG